MTDDKMVRYEFEQTPGDIEGQGSLVCLTNDNGQGE